MHAVCRRPSCNTSEWQSDLAPDATLKQLLHEIKCMSAYHSVCLIQDQRILPHLNVVAIPVSV